MANPVTVARKSKSDMHRSLGITKDQVEALAESARLRNIRVSEALSKSRGKNRDRIILEEMLAQSTEIASLVNSSAVASGGARGVKYMRELNADIREIMEDLRRMSSNEDSIAFIDRSMQKIIDILSNQDLYLQKGVKDEVMRHCSPEVASLIIDRINMLVQGKSALYDEVRQLMIEAARNFLDE